jgi:hypothetical protein
MSTDPAQQFADLLHGAATRGTERVIGVPDTAGPDGEWTDDPAEAFGRFLHDATCPAGNVEPLNDEQMTEALSRLPAPNLAQGSSAATPAPTLGQQLAYHDQQMQDFADLLHHKINTATGDGGWRTGTAYL